MMERVVVTSSLDPSLDVAPRATAASAVQAAVLARSPTSLPPLLPLRTIANFRDIGGDTTALRRRRPQRPNRRSIERGGNENEEEEEEEDAVVRVRAGCIFRSARPDHLSDEEARHLISDVGIRTVLDLRAVEEARRVRDANDRLRTQFKPVLVHFHRFGRRITYIEGRTHPPRSVANDAERSSSSGSSSSTPTIAPSPSALVDAATAARAGPGANANAEVASTGSGLQQQGRTLYQLDLAGSALLDSAPLWVRLVGAVLYLLGQKLWAVRFVVKYGINPFGLYGMYVAICECCQPRVAVALRIVAEPANYPILIHCTQGKDRTGLIVAFVLHVLGVDEDTVRLVRQVGWSTGERMRRGEADDGIWSGVPVCVDRP